MINTRYKESEYHRWKQKACEVIAATTKPKIILQVMEETQVVKDVVKKSPKTK